MIEKELVPVMGNTVPIVASERKECVKRLRDAMLFGDAEPIEVITKFRAFDKFEKEALADSVISQLIKDAAVSGGEYNGAKITARTKRTPDYPAAGSKTWMQLRLAKTELEAKRNEMTAEIDAEIEEIGRKLKAVEAQLDQASEETPYVDPEDGMMIFDVPADVEVTATVTLPK